MVAPTHLILLSGLADIIVIFQMNKKVVQTRPIC
jgi:hypothetical protein